MKKKITTSLIFATLALFANEPTNLVSNTLPAEPKAFAGEKVSKESSSFFYLKMSALDSYPTNSVQVVPGLGLGYRLNAGSGAIDFSANYTGGRGFNGKTKAYFYTVPKATYLHYLSPSKDQSFYAGAGLAWGGIKTKDGRRFEGIIPNATLGYELNRKEMLRTFIQLDVSQPAIPARVSDTFPGPIAEMAVGAGF